MSLNFCRKKEKKHRFLLFGNGVHCSWLVHMTKSCRGYGDERWRKRRRIVTTITTTNTNTDIIIMTNSTSPGDDFPLCVRLRSLPISTEIYIWHFTHFSTEPLLHCTQMIIYHQSENNSRLYICSSYSSSFSSFSSASFFFISGWIREHSIISCCRMVGRVHNNNNNSNNLAHGKKSNFLNAIKAFVRFLFSLWRSRK